MDLDPFVFMFPSTMPSDFELSILIGVACCRWTNYLVMFLRIVPPFVLMKSAATSTLNASNMTYQTMVAITYNAPLLISGCPSFGLSVKNDPSTGVECWSEFIMYAITS